MARVLDDSGRYDSLWICKGVENAGGHGYSRGSGGGDGSGSGPRTQTFHTLVPSKQVVVERLFPGSFVLGLSLLLCICIYASITTMGNNFSSAQSQSPESLK